MICSVSKIALNMFVGVFRKMNFLEKLHLLVRTMKMNDDNNKEKYVGFRPNSSEN